MDAATRATHAKQLLDDPLLTEVLDTLEAEAIDAWKRTADDQSELRERLFQMVLANQRLRAKLHSIRDNGLIEANRSVRLASSRP